MSAILPIFTTIGNRVTLGNWLAFDIAGEFVLGHDFQTLGTTDNRFMIDVIVALNRRSGTYAQSPSLARLRLGLVWWPADCATLTKGLRLRRHVTQKLAREEASSATSFKSVLGGKFAKSETQGTYDGIMPEAQVLLVAGEADPASNCHGC